MRMKDKQQATVESAGARDGSHSAVCNVEVQLNSLSPSDDVPVKLRKYLVSDTLKNDAAGPGCVAGTPIAYAGTSA